MELIQNRIEQYKELAAVSKEHEEAIDVIVPDINPDVLSIVHATGSCSIREKQVGAGSVTVSGDIFIKVLYSTEEDKLYSLSGQIPYNYNYEAAGAMAGDTAVVAVKVINAGAAALNPRKLTLKAEVGVDVRLFQPSALEIVEGAAGAADEGINVRTAADSWAYLGAVPEKKIAFNEEIRLISGNVSDSDKLLRSDLTWVAEDVKVLTNKVMLRGNAVVRVITMPENGGGVMENTYKLPFSQIIESDGVDQEDRVEIDFQTLQFETQFVTRGENELYLYCNIFGCATVFVEKQAQVTLLEDMYSTAYDMSFDTAEVYGGTGQPATLQTDADGIIEVEVPAVKVLDYSVCPRARCTMDMISGSFYFRVLYENQDGRVCSAARRIDVETAGEALCAVGCVKAGADAVSVGVDATGAIQISFRAVFEAQTLCKTPRKYIKSCRLDTDKPLGRARDASLVLRAAQDGESVWSIAKQYRTSPEAIVSANRLEGENDLAPGRLIIIPFVQ